MNDPSPTIVGCLAVNEHISKPIPNTLWHYTSYDALKGIVSSKKIWATEYRFLNDREEFRHAKTLAQQLVDEETEFSDQMFPAREFLRKAVDIAFNTGYLHEERLRIMVASFSEEGDQLSQWRGYPFNRLNQEGPIFCRDLILGSGSHPSAKVGIDLFLQKEGVRVLARPSKIPYRPT